MTRVVGGAVAVYLLILAAACDEAIPTTYPTRTSAEAARAIVSLPSAGPTLDDLLLKIADQSPGFGGMYWDSAGEVQIVHTRSDALPEAIDAVRAVMGGNHPAFQLGRAMHLRAGQFDFRQLTNYRSAIEAATDRSGFVFGDVDEVHNRVWFGVDAAAVRGRIMRAVTQLGIPPQAVEVDVVTRPHFATTVDDRGSTLAGGLIIGFPFGYFGCTLGFPASDWLGAQNLITAGHCAPPMGSVNPALFVSQPFTGVNEGHELQDPPYTALPGCPPGDLCRYSDAVLFTWQNNPTYGTQSYGLGLIATPAWDNYTWGNYGPTAYTDYSTIIGETPDSFLLPASPGGPLMGLPLSKVGATTGFTTGEVRQSCFTVYSAGGPNLDHLCQFSTDTFAASGDSGSPLMNRDLWPRVYLSGIVSAVDDPDQRTWFSSIAGIQRDFGALQTYPAKPHP
jgi:hypothetical protein